jgi:ribosomal-protein-alanine acetyltransferase
MAASPPSLTPITTRFVPNAVMRWRPLVTADVAYVAALEAHIHAAPWTPDNFREALAAGYSARVGEREGRIVAYGVLMLAPGEAQLLNLSVVPDARRGGLGRELLMQFLDDARRLGAEQVFLEVRESNKPAIALYERVGFHCVARRQSYYPAASAGEAREDALVMRRTSGET